ncbi:1,3-beta-glucanosyltransferase-like protein [Thermochaetoides thermophila DSM 1495]|uniref:1,3-beta-glucanosyltransferase n=1 Tax=Chaetomium thermophilum (strain DSM 1495 / CBS 144.50 / IMI 039719) TaxID=759272 RepID=G0SH48_CHATD|nr:1,3-beta-glucanosyltransferase-like protein [Thermochaetoides thermophila DSM 1495]EGS17537.1 1,3-beta-glucanosyltransferase-like protein [Thermochaetoides thermophila DSM 1495]
MRLTKTSLGTKFFYENGTQFFIKGIAYQQEFGAAGTGASKNTKYVDPLANPAACRRDVPLLKALRTNAIRTYAIDPTADHDECMKLLDEAGIYVISDLSEPTLSINRDDPRWDVDLYKRYTAVVDSLSKYSNVIGFFAGNEVTNNNTNTQASAYVKAAVRDTKAYIKKNVNRWMGVGYAANDDPDIREDIAHYFNCGDQDDAIDFWGYNIYSWCGKSSMEKSGYDKQVEYFRNYSVPVFFAEYGCNLPNGADGRIWDETVALYSDEMTDVISGGIVYMFFQEANDYGLVTLKGDKVSTMKNYDALKTVMATVNPSSTSMDAYTPTNSPAACPEISKNWKVKGSALPPTPDESLCECMYDQLLCVPAEDLDPEDYGEIFGYICGETPEACVGISGNATSGVYGAYSMCSAKQQLGYVLDAYYNAQNRAQYACDFNGKAVTRTTSGKVDASCGAALESASAANSYAATATSEPDAEESSNAAMPGQMPRAFFALGDLVVGAYVLVAMAVGASMVLL